jgi:hypothetical protein
MLISLHLPKTAGSSFFAALKNHYGETILPDYADLPINTPPLKRNFHALTSCFINSLRFADNIQCVHGHFLPLKYRLCKASRFITWLRDPVERVASHYFHWQRHYDPQIAPPLQRKVIEEHWSLERFCLAPELRNLYHQFLWGFPVKRFDFIGITEHYDTELAWFSQQILGTTLTVSRDNINPDKAQTSYFDDPALRDKIKRYHRQDVLLYEQALRDKERRKPSY